jgi:hypothetical protein
MVVSQKDKPWISSRSSPREPFSQDWPNFSIIQTYISQRCQAAARQELLYAGMFRRLVEYRNKEN